MRIAVTLALASLGALIAAALYVRGMRGRGQRANLLTQEKASAESETRPQPQAEVSVHAEELKPVPQKPSVLSVEVETNTDESLDGPRSARRQPRHALEAISARLIQSAQPKTPEAAPFITETEDPQGKESPVELEFTQEGEHLPMPNSLDGKDGATESVSPDGRGGRPRTTTQEGEPDKTVKPAWRFQMPEIVCWKRAREWIIAVELPDELQDTQGISVSQDSVDLLEDELEKGSWPLAELRGEVVVRAVDHGDMI